MKTITALLTIATTGFLSAAPVFAAPEKDADMTTVKGEIIDLACYTDHGASGEKHAGCAKKCISSGLPVGIKTEDGKVYTVIGSHKPMNQELAEYAGKTVTLKGKAVTRDGVNLLENTEIEK